MQDRSPQKRILDMNKRYASNECLLYMFLIKKPDNLAMVTVCPTLLYKDGHVSTREHFILPVTYLSLSLSPHAMASIWLMS